MMPGVAREAPDCRHGTSEAPKGPRDLVMFFPIPVAFRKMLTSNDSPAAHITTFIALAATILHVSKYSIIFRHSSHLAARDLIVAIATGVADNGDTANVIDTPSQLPMDILISQGS